MLLFLFAPIAVMIVFSFNDPAGDEHHLAGIHAPELRRPVGAVANHRPMMKSLAVATISTVVATVLGTMIALALTRYRFRWRGGIMNLLIFVPMTAPEIILGARC